MVPLPELELVSPMGNGTVAGSRDGVEIIELIPNGLRIVLTVRGLLICPVCEDDGNSDAWWISGSIVIRNEWLGSISGGMQL